VARIGIDLGGTKIEAVLVNDNGMVEARHRVATPRNDYDATVQAVVALVGVLDRQSGRTSSVGIGTPGALDPSSGTMKNCNSTWLNGRPLLNDLVQQLGIRVRIANDADCFALSEATDGAAAGARVAFGAILGTGVGGGIVVEGRLLRGPNGIAGEWGHTPLPYLRRDPCDDLESSLADRNCYCGRVSCIETFLSGPGLVATHESLWGNRLTAEAIASRLDSQAARTLELYLRQLARSLAQVINILDPDILVLGGGLSQIHEIYRRVPELWQRYVFSSRVDTVLAPAVHGPASGVRGATWLWPADYNCNST
jgi:fructokinase